VISIVVIVDLKFVARTILMANITSEANGVIARLEVVTEYVLPRACMEACHWLNVFY